MTATGYATSLAVEGARLSALAADAERRESNLRARVPSCPDWHLEALIEHCAMVWAFVGASVAAGERADRSKLTKPEGPLSHRHDTAFGDLTEALNARTPDEQIWTFDPDIQSVSFWWRRMAHEASMHRWDAESALGISPAPIDPALAVDGIDELFDFFIPRRKPTAWSGDGQTVHLHATDTDGEWLITRTPNGITVERAHGRADAAARGPAQDLLLFAWGRIEPARLETFGDDALLAEWQDHVKF